MALASSYSRELPFFEIPVVDILKLKGEDVDDKSTESQKLVDAFTQIGFCLLKNMDVVGYNREKIWEFVQWFYRDTSFEEREQQLGIKGKNVENIHLIVVWHRVSCSLDSNHPGHKLHTQKFIQKSSI